MILAVGDSFFDSSAACYLNTKLKTWPEHFDGDVKVIGYSGCDNYKIFQTIMEEFDKHNYDTLCVNWTQLHRCTIGTSNFAMSGREKGNEANFIKHLSELTQWYQLRVMIERFTALRRAISYLPCKTYEIMGAYPFGPKTKYNYIGKQKTQDIYWDLIENSAHVRLASHVKETAGAKWTDVFIAENDGHPNNEGHELIYNWIKDKL